MVHFVLITHILLFVLIISMDAQVVVCVCFMQYVS